MEHHQESSLSWWYRIIPPCFLIFFTTLIYYPSLHYDFQFDDLPNITKHFDIRHYDLSKLFFSGTRWISYWINSLHYKIGKFNPFSYRLGNLILHTVNGLLVFFILLLLLTRLSQKSFFKKNAVALSFITALLFLLHPVQTQTVSYVIQGQLEGLAAFFSLSMVLCFLWLNYATTQIMRIFTGILFFILAIFSCGSKEIAIVTPFLILLVDWFFIAHGSLSSLKKRALFHIATSSIIFGIYIYLLKPQFFINLFGLRLMVGNNLGNMITTTPHEMITPYYFFISQFKVILHYLWIFIWPFNISVEYDWKLAKSFMAPDCLFPCSIILLLFFVLYKLLQKKPTNIIGFAALWFAINITPRSSIVPSPELLVDYKTYLASFGWLFIIAAAIVKLYEYIKWHSPTFKFIIDRYYASYGLIIIAVGILGFGTFERNKVWRSGLEFWANIVDNAPGKSRAYNNYGVELSQNQKRFADAIPYFEHAIRMDKFYRDPYNNLAVAYAATHQLDRAIATLAAVLQICPHAEAYNNLASFFIEKKEYKHAETALFAAIKMRSYYGKAYFNLGRLYMEINESEKACEAFRKACMEADLDNEAGFFGYAKCCLHLQKYDEGIFACKKVLECNPHNYEIEFSLANAYYMKHDFDNAARTYQQMIHKNPTDAKLWYNLAETHFSAHRFKDALTCFERIAQHPDITPNVFVRIAACHETLGNPHKAKQILETLLHKNLPVSAKNVITTALQKLIQQYHLA